MAGVIPVLQALDHGLRTERFTLLVGILNGTTNYILSTMEREGRDFAEALDAARKLGFAEADPSLDLSGADTAQKLTILVRRAFRASVPHGSIPTEGIVGMELEDLRQADRFGYVVKLLGIALRTPDGLDLRVHPGVHPEALPPRVRARRVQRRLPPRRGLGLDAALRKGRRRASRRRRPCSATCSRRAREGRSGSRRRAAPGTARDGAGGLGRGAL